MLFHYEINVKNETILDISCRIEKIEKKVERCEYFLNALD